MNEGEKRLTIFTLLANRIERPVKTQDHRRLSENRIVFRNQGIRRELQQVYG